MGQDATVRLADVTPPCRKERHTNEWTENV